jgi:ribosomal protein S8E
MCGFVGFANLKENISSKTNIYNMNESISKEVLMKMDIITRSTFVLVIKD